MRINAKMAQRLNTLMESTATRKLAKAERIGVWPEHIVSERYYVMLSWARDFSEEEPCQCPWGNLGSPEMSFFLRDLALQGAGSLPTIEALAEAVQSKYPDHYQHFVAALHTRTFDRELRQRERAEAAAQQM